MTDNEDRKTFSNEIKKQIFNDCSQTKVVFDLPENPSLLAFIGL